MTAQLTRGTVARRHSRVVEWPSVALCATIYGGFAAVTFWHARLPSPLVAVMGALLVAWHASMQHEFIHAIPHPGDA